MWLLVCVIVFTVERVRARRRRHATRFYEDTRIIHEETLIVEWLLSH